MSDVVKMLQGEIPVEAPVITSRSSIRGDLWESLDNFSQERPSEYFYKYSEEGPSETVEMPHTY